MKEIDRRKPNNKQSKPSGRSERTDRKQHQENVRKKLNAKETESKALIETESKALIETESKALIAEGESVNLVSDSNTGTDTSEVYENTVIHYVDDVNRFEEVSKDYKFSPVIGRMDKGEILDDHSSDLEKQPKRGKEEESDSETTKDSVSSQEDSLMVEVQKVEKVPRVPESVVNRSLSESSSVGSRARSNQDTYKSKTKALQNTPKKSIKSNRGVSEVTAKNSSDKNSNKIRAPSKPSSESFEVAVDKTAEEIKETDVLDEISNDAQSIESDNETIDTEENGEHVDEASLNKKIEAMEMRIEKLEEELRDVAALEISLYSVVPEHGSSAHKVHTPARRLSRLFIHACKHWTQNRRATIAKNTVSGLVLVAKSCGNDVSRLSFWLSNTIVLREIISQAFGISRRSVPVTRLAESNVASEKNEVKSMTLKWKGASVSKQVNGLLQLDEDWQETATFNTALVKVESWIFSRIVESVWWQVLTPYMQSPALTTNKTTGNLLGPALGDQQQGSFSINLWRNAFLEALQRLCPVRAGGHECGCLPVLTRIVMEQCVARLDVAMFNAILRESAREIPTDPISDPIVDSKVLPIRAGDLSFGSGAQLKNSVGNWSRWLSDTFGMDSDDSLKDQHSSEDDDRLDGVREPKSFVLLNDLSDLLMLPKDMLMDRSIRQEVCPSIGLALIKRVLCNFTPDEFCPDPVPGAVLEALNAESIVERRLSGDSARSFPYSAAPVTYTPPSLSDVAEKVAEAGGKAPLSRNVSAMQRKGYTSDEELEELDSPLSLITEKLPLSPTIAPSGNGNGNHIGKAGYRGSNARYELLREVWTSS